MNVYQKLSDARKEFHAMKLKKTGHNKFAGYDYFELGDFLIPAMEAFRNNGLIGIVDFGTDEAHLRIINIENPQEITVISSPMSSAALKGCHEVQNLGAVQTYLRRYLWVAAMEIVEHDALDSSAPIQSDAPKLDHKSVPASEFEKLDPESQKYIRELADEVLSCKSTDEQVQFLANVILEVEEKTALWSLLDSKTRSAIKKASKPVTA